MRFLVSILLFLFVTFLSAPTIVGMLEDEADVSMFYSLTEEEIQKEVKEINADLYKEFNFTFLSLTPKSSLINTDNLQKHDNVFEEIFSPPPEII